MKKWCALLMTMLLILTTAGAEEFSGGKDFWDDAYRCTVENGYLTFQSDDGTTYQPIAVKDGFAEAAKALAAQGDTFVAVPMGLTQALLPYVADELTGGAELVEIYCTTALVGMHLRDAAMCFAWRGGRATAIKWLIKSSGRIFRWTRCTSRQAKSAWKSKDRNTP